MQHCKASSRVGQKHLGALLEANPEKVMAALLQMERIDLRAIAF